MKPLAIHDQTWGFTPRWIEYCETNSVPFILVDCYKNNIIDVLKTCSALMWQWDYANYKDSVFARQLMVSLGLMDIEVFPDFWTTFVFDDKLGQKYLFESLGIPVPKTYSFYDKKVAMEWARTIKYPVVFKLRCGAGSQNVRLVESFAHSKSLIKKSFSTGFNYINKKQVLRDRFMMLMKHRTSKELRNIGKSLYRFIFPRYDEKIIHRESGYIMFQEFLPDNTYDTRLIVLGNRCFGMRRYNRKNDFRASGSHNEDYSIEQIDKRAIKVAFDLAEKIKTRMVVLDFIFNKQNNPVITEMSFSFVDMDKCLGFWDSEFNWHEGKQNMQYLMVEDILASVRKKDLEMKNSHD